jgi:hypothetical protein
MKTLKKYIKNTLRQGYKPERIREYLISKGYDDKVVDEILSQYTHKAKEREIVLFRKKTKPQEEVLKEDDNPTPVESPKSGLKSQLEEVNEKLNFLTKRDIKQEHKEFRLPSKVKKQLKKLAVKNKMLVIYLTRNKGMLPLVQEIKDGSIMIDGKPHDVNIDSVFLWKGKYPSVVVPEWDLKPIGTESYYDAVEQNRIADPVATAIRIIENSANPEKKKLSPKAWIFIGLAIIAGIYVLVGGV